MRSSVFSARMARSLLRSMISTVCPLFSTVTVTCTCASSGKNSRRVVKYRKRLGTKLTAAAAEIPATEPEESMDIVREKHFALKPCSTEEAILQMDLLGHSFFLYHSTENDKIQVVYRRADGGYGVLIPEA